MPSMIRYNTTGATAGTSVTFGEPAEVIDLSYHSEGGNFESDNGTRWRSLKSQAQIWRVKINYEASAVKASYYSFWQTAGSKGESFVFWPTFADISTYYNVTLEEDSQSDFKPTRFAQNLPDRWQWEFTVRRVI